MNSREENLRYPFSFSFHLPSQYFDVSIGTAHTQIRFLIRVPYSNTQIWNDFRMKTNGRNFAMFALKTV